ncbi:CE1759 family FMN reductase [Streptomyces sp. NPDC048659]|uniref:CE1759 family FMN reductase n=1 Tax=Streptomyces sp. NPDC048659 TaxID=3155489 RepID=UPI00341DA098
MRLVVVNGEPGATPEARSLADRLAVSTRSRVARRGEALDVVTIELRDVAHDIGDASLTGQAAPALRTHLDTVRGADGLIVVTPTLHASYSGLFKSFFDLLEADALADKPTLPAATGADPRHALVLESALRPLLARLGAHTVPTGVYATPADRAADGDTGEELAARTHRATNQLAALMVTSRMDGFMPEPGAAADDTHLTESDLVPFERQLAALRGDEPTHTHH